MGIESITGQCFLTVYFLEVKTAFDTQCIVTQPLLIWLRRFHHSIDVIGTKKLTFLRIDRQDITRAYTAFRHNIFRLIVVYTDFGCHGDEVVLRDHPARRTQTIAVKATNSIATVCCYQAGRTIPRFHVHGVVFVERTQVSVHRLNVLPRRRNHHTNRTENIHSTHRQQLKHVVHRR